MDIFTTTFQGFQKENISKKINTIISPLNRFCLAFGIEKGYNNTQGLSNKCKTILMERENKCYSCRKHFQKTLSMKSDGKDMKG
jgi:hypothetical protein